MKSANLRYVCLTGVLWVIFRLTVAGVPSASAQERLCDSAFEDCRTPLWRLINNETVGIDVAFWFMQDTSYANMIISRFQSGVRVRILVDPRANPTYSGNQQILEQFKAAGIPMRFKNGGGILHWKMMLFASQNKVQFSGANYSPAFFVPTAPHQDYIDEALYFTDDPSLVNSFKTKFDDLWTDTANYSDFGNINGPLTRSYPTFTIDPALNLPPITDFRFDDTFRNRSINAYNQETQKIDAIMYRITDRTHTDTILNTVQRGIPVRLITEQDEYRNRARQWVSWNVDRLHMGGVQVKIRKHQGLNHEKAVLLYGQGLTIFGSSNWTTPSSNSQQEHNYFTTKPWIFQWFVNHFEWKWNSAAEFQPFVPLNPDAPVYTSPADAATGQPTTVTLAWEGGPWAHKFDIYLGTSSNPPLIRSDVFLGAVDDGVPESFTVTGLAPGTTYFWKIVGKTMAEMTAAGPVRRFTTAGASLTSPPVVSSVSPASGPHHQGTAVTINGSNFAAGAQVSFGHIAATSVNVTSATSISAVAPPHAPGGVEVVVTNPNGQSGRLANGFTYTGAPAAPSPKVNLVSPGSGTTNGGTSVVITGSGFAAGASVEFDGGPATSVVVSNHAKITAVTPAHAAGPVDVTVTNPNAQSSTLRSGYTYAGPAPPPSISAISPTSGPTSGGTTVSITGTGFVHGAAVSFGSSAATNVIVINSNSISVATPGRSTGGAVDVTVTNPDGGSDVVTGGFTYGGASSPAPVVTSVSPNTGPTSGGTIVTISGNNFAAGASVSFGGAAGTDISVINSTSIRATAPMHAAGAVVVSVRNSDGQTGQLGGGFTYTSSSNQPPQVSITASPTSGIAPLTVNFTSSASDPDGQVTAFNWDFGDGQTSSQPSPSNTYQRAGSFTARLTVTDDDGATSSASVLIKIPVSDDDIVLYASEASVRAGKWVVQADSTAAGGAKIRHPDAGGAKLAGPLANPVDYFELTFDAQAGVDYRLWIRGRADADSPYNDSYFVQFSNSVNSSGSPVYRIGTTDATTVNLEDCSGCGLQGWGWQDNGWGIGVMGPTIRFGTAGPQRLRIQTREDGLSIDQVVLSPATYLNGSPGLLKNDSTILPKIDGSQTAAPTSSLSPAPGSVRKGAQRPIVQC